MAEADAIALVERHVLEAEQLVLRLLDEVRGAHEAASAADVLGPAGQRLLGRLHALADFLSAVRAASFPAVLIAVMEAWHEAGGSDA